MISVDIKTNDNRATVVNAAMPGKEFIGIPHTDCKSHHSNVVVESTVDRAKDDS